MKQCANCGNGYYRRNRLQLWTSRNPGKRDGWTQADVRLCLTCSPQEQTSHLMTVASVKITKQGVVRPFKRGAQRLYLH